MISPIFVPLTKLLGGTMPIPAIAVLGHNLETNSHHGRRSILHEAAKLVLWLVCEDLWKKDKDEES